MPEELRERRGARRRRRAARHAVDGARPDRCSAARAARGRRVRRGGARAIAGRDASRPRTASARRDPLSDRMGVERQRKHDGDAEGGQRRARSNQLIGDAAEPPKGCRRDNGTLDRNPRSEPERREQARDTDRSQGPSPAAPASSARISASCCSHDGWEVFALDDLSTGSTRQRRAPAGALRTSISSSTRVLSPRSSTSSCTSATSSTTWPPRSGVRLIVEQPVRTLVTNIQGTEIVLEYCDRFGKRVLFASTSEVYGDHREEKPLAEDARRIYGPTTARRWAYADRRRWTSSSRSPTTRRRGLDCVIVAALQHRRPAPERPVRDGHSPLRRARARGRAARGARRRSRRAASATSPTRSAR